MKFLMCFFVGYSRVQKGYRCYCPTLRYYFMSINVAFFETTPFSQSSTVTSQGEGDDLLAYTISLPVPTLAPTPISTAPALAQIKPPITQVYSQHQNPPVSSPTMVASSSDPMQKFDLPIALHKGKCQCAHLISLFISYNHLSFSSYSFIASLDFISLPNIVREALSHHGWRSVMADEMQALDDNGTWDLVPFFFWINKNLLPKGKPKNQERKRELTVHRRPEQRRLLARRLLVVVGCLQ